jgi:hypothetical protein
MADEPQDSQLDDSANNGGEFIAIIPAEQKHRPVYNPNKNAPDRPNDLFHLILHRDLDAQITIGKAANSVFPVKGVRLINLFFYTPYSTYWSYWVITVSITHVSPIPVQPRLSVNRREIVIAFHIFSSNFIVRPEPQEILTTMIVLPLTMPSQTIGFSYTSNAEQKQPQTTSPGAFCPVWH